MLTPLSSIAGQPHKSFRPCRFHCGAAAAVRQQFAFCALFEFAVIPIGLHPADPHVCDPVRKNISHLAVLDPAAGIDIPGRKNSHMAVAAVAAAVYHAVLRILRDFEYPFFIFVKRPKMVFFVEAGLAAFGLVFLIFLITDIQKLPVVLRCHAGVLFAAGRAVAGGKRTHLRPLSPPCR